MPVLRVLLDLQDQLVLQEMLETLVRMDRWVTLENRVLEVLWVSEDP